MKNESNLNFSIVQPGSEKEHWYTWPPVTWPQRKAQREKPSGRSETCRTASGRTCARLRHPEAQQGRESPRFEDEGSPNLRMDLRPCLVLNVGHQDRKNDTCKLLCLGKHVRPRLAPDQNQSARLPIPPVPRCPQLLHTSDK